MCQKSYDTTIVGCCYNMVKYIMILQCALQWRQQDMNHPVNSQKSPHNLPCRVSYGVSFVRIWEKIYRIITSLQYVENWGQYVILFRNISWIALTHWCQWPLSVRDRATLTLSLPWLPKLTYHWWLDSTMLAAPTNRVQAVGKGAAWH